MKRTSGASNAPGKRASGKRTERDLDDDETFLPEAWEERPLHKNARTTREMRQTFQRSNESSRSLARQYGVNEKTVSKHRRRYGVDDLPAGRRSQAFTPSEAELIERFRCFTHFNLRDCVLRLKPVIPQLNLNNLHRLLKSVGVNRLPWGKTTSIKKENSESRIGCFHIFVLRRKAAPTTSLIAFGEERGEVFAFFMKEPTPRKAAYFVTMLKARCPALRLLIAPDDPLFGVRPPPRPPRQQKPRSADDRARARRAALAGEAERDRYLDHPFMQACERSQVMRGHAEPIFRPTF